MVDLQNTKEPAFFFSFLFYQQNDLIQEKQRTCNLDKETRQPLGKCRDHRRESCFYSGEEEAGRGFYSLPLAECGGLHGMGCCWAKRHSSFLLLGQVS